jgi:hypothetical protein
VFGAKALVTVANAERMRTGDERMIAVLLVYYLMLYKQTGQRLDRRRQVALLYCFVCFFMLAVFCFFFLDMRTHTNSDVVKYIQSSS